MERIPDQATAAICGLFCGTCPSFPKDCHGCLSDKLNPSCAVCGNGFRKCADTHKVIRCCDCTDFPCERLDTFSHEHWHNDIGHHVNVIPDLHRMRELGVDAWVEEQTSCHSCPACGKLIPWYERDCPHCK